MKITHEVRFDDGGSLSDLTAKANDFYAKTIAKIYRSYESILRSNDAVDFDDLLLCTAQLLGRDAEVRNELQQRYQYLLIDEYQDTNGSQYKITQLLAESHRSLCVVGDDDQSIYSWRGAEVANILKFEKDFPGAAVIKLEQNYRSTPQILAAASGLIDANSERLGKTLWTELPAGEKVRVIGVWDAPEEARRVGEEIERLEAEGAPLDEVAILVRAQYQTREFEDRFIQIGLNYRIVGGFRFYERAEIRDALAYLRTIAQPADDLAMFQHEGRLVTADLEHAARALTAGGIMAESGIEEAGVMHPELAYHGDIGRHLGGVGGRDMHGLAADQNIEGAGVEDQVTAGAVQLFPELQRIVMADPVKIDHPGMGFGAVAHQRALCRLQIDGEAEAAIDHRLAVDKRCLGVDSAQGGVVQHRLTLAKTDLVEPHAGADKHGE